MTQEFQIRVLPEVAASEKAIKHFLQEEKGLAAGTIKAVRVLKRSIDARQRTIYVNLKVRVYVNELPEDDEYVKTDYPNVEGRPQAVVVGAGVAQARSRTANYIHAARNAAMWRRF